MTSWPDSDRIWDVASQILPFLVSSYFVLGLPLPGDPWKEFKDLLESTRKAVRNRANAVVKDIDPSADRERLSGSVAANVDEEAIEQVAANAARAAGAFRSSVLSGLAWFLVVRNDWAWLGLGLILTAGYLVQNRPNARMPSRWPFANDRTVAEMATLCFNAVAFVVVLWSQI